MPAASQGRRAEGSGRNGPYPNVIWDYGTGTGFVPGPGWDSGYEYIGMETSQEYADIANKRILLAISQKEATGAVQ